LGASISSGLIIQTKYTGRQLGSFNDQDVILADDMEGTLKWKVGDKALGTGTVTKATAECWNGSNALKILSGTNANNQEDAVRSFTLSPYGSGQYVVKMNLLFYSAESVKKTVQFDFILSNSQTYSTYSFKIVSDGAAKTDAKHFYYVDTGGNDVLIADIECWNKYSDAPTSYAWYEIIFELNNKTSRYVALQFAGRRYLIDAPAFDGVTTVGHSIISIMLKNVDVGITQSIYVDDVLITQV